MKYLIFQSCVEMLLVPAPGNCPELWLHEFADKVSLWRCYNEERCRKHVEESGDMYVLDMYIYYI